MVKALRITGHWLFFTLLLPVFFFHAVWPLLAQWITYPVYESRRMTEEDEEREQE